MKKLKFVVQKHSATKLHFDFRLELDDVAKSWAIPKEPPRKEGIKVLAIQVDDHEVEYMGFEGTIPKGQYGAGKVKIWDKGSYEMIDKKENKMVLNLDGKKLKGEFVLLKFKKAGENSWLFFKKKK